MPGCLPTYAPELPCELGWELIIPKYPVLKVQDLERGEDDRSLCCGPSVCGAVSFGPLFTFLVSSHHRLVELPSRFYRTFVEN